MPLKQALKSAVEQLESADVGLPRLNAETLLMFVLGGPKKQEAARVFPLVGPGSVGLGGAF